MLDKLFVRVRSWLHNDPTGVLGDPALPAPGGPAKKNGNGNGKRSGKGKDTPPPLPPDAWAAESESGMVITESGIIIIDPALMDANKVAPPRPASMIVPADSAWALPNLPRPGAATPVSANATSASDAGALNWDEVLARAKARINAVPDPGPGSPPKQTRAK
jgi:hypothetical protein